MPRRRWRGLADGHYRVDAPEQGLRADLTCHARTPAHEEARSLRNARSRLTGRLHPPATGSPATWGERVGLGVLEQAVFGPYEPGGFPARGPSSLESSG